MNYIKEQLTKSGYNKDDIKNFTYGYTVGGTSIYISILGLSYKYHPTSRLLKSNWYLTRQNNLLAKFPKIKNKISYYHQKASVWAHDSNLITYLSKNMNLNRKRFAKAVVESIIINKVGTPLFLPLEILIAYSYMKYLKE